MPEARSGSGCGCRLDLLADGTTKPTNSPWSDGDDLVAPVSITRSKRGMQGGVSAIREDMNWAELIAGCVGEFAACSPPLGQLDGQTAHNVSQATGLGPGSHLCAHKHDVERGCWSWCANSIACCLGDHRAPGAGCGSGCLPDSCCCCLGGWCAHGHGPWGC